MWELYYKRQCEYVFSRAFRYIYCFNNYSVYYDNFSLDISMLLI